MMDDGSYAGRSASAGWMRMLVNALIKVLEDVGVSRVLMHSYYYSHIP
jgi:hypothetical protein